VDRSAVIGNGDSLDQIKPHPEENHQQQRPIAHVTGELGQDAKEGRPENNGQFFHHIIKAEKGTISSRLFLTYNFKISSGNARYSGAA
jgi:hypothetical protein